MSGAAPSPATERQRRHRERQRQGVHLVKPWARLDAMGLVPMLQGRRITALSEARAEFRDHGGGELTYRRARTPCPAEVCLIWI